jgi:Holliday junction DNA helicase RuvB
MSLTAKIEIAEDTINSKIRPQMLAEFIGQSKAKENLKVFIAAAKQRQTALDHTLLYGPPGLGKTTIAQIISHELGVNFRATSGPMLTKAGDLAAILTNLQENDVLFIDEIHRLSTAVEEVLYPAMEDFNMDLIIGEGPAARTVRIDIPRFTLVGATTRIGLLTNPLRDRFGIPLRLEFYEISELVAVIKRGIKIIGGNLTDAALTDDGALEIARRSRGTPRIALRLLRRVWDFASVAEEKIINKQIADNALNRLEVDNFGLDSADIRYLKYIAENYDGGPVGIETISAGLSEQRDSIEEAVEPYLLQQGFIQRTPRGRMITPKAFEHLGMKQKKPNLQQALQETLLEDL